jgi:imidazolonepropionase-like amidohydrolase
MADASAREVELSSLLPTSHPSGPSRSGRDSHSPGPLRSPHLFRWVFLPTLVAFFAIFTMLLLSTRSSSSSPSPPFPFPSDTCTTPSSGLNPENYLDKNTGFPRGRFIIVNAVDHEMGKAMDVLVRDGVIEQVGAALERPEGVQVIDVRGRVVTCGLVDMHSHAGVYPFPGDLDMNQDGNEMTAPTMPGVQALDSFWPEDDALDMIRAGGVTSILVLPGSGDTMGGQGRRFKLRPNLRTAAEMLDDRATARRVVLKWALGENPMRVFGTDKGVLPSSRMGNIYVIRKKLTEAQALRDAQDDYCAGRLPSVLRRPSDMDLEPLVQLLRGNANLNIHSYMIQDFEAALRLSREFNFTISAFHHALEAYKIGPVLQKANVTVATFSDLFGYKLEAYNGLPYAPAWLEAAGVRVALKSDHPVIHSARLIEEAAKARHYGLRKAFEAVSAVPADSIGLGSHVGRLRAGNDADIVVWTRHPFTMGATPELVFVEGALATGVIPLGAPRSDCAAVPPVYPPLPAGSSGGGAFPSGSYPCYAFRSAGGQIFDGLGGVFVRDSTTVVVVNGVITCASISSPCAIPASCAVIDLPDKSSIAPSLIETGTDLMLDISAEKNTQDGAVDEPNGAHLASRHGFVPGTRHCQAAFSGGVGLVVTPPQGGKTLAGTSSAFSTSRASVLPRLALSERAGKATALHVSLGLEHKGKAGSASVSGQISLVLGFFAKAKAANETSLEPGSAEAVGKQCLAGDLPVIVHTHSAVVMATVLDSFPPTVRVIFRGAAEAYLIKDLLASRKVPVILAPVRCVPKYFWSLARCKPYSHGTLLLAGVELAVAYDDSDNIRNLRFELGAVVNHSPESGPGNIPAAKALAMASGTLAKILGLAPGTGTIAPGAPARIAVYSAGPLDLGSQLLFHTDLDYLENRPLPDLVDKYRQLPGET